jgi:hypothetical protein
MRSLRSVCLLTIFLSAIAFARSNPRPLINQPLVPESATPGSGEFTLTVNGSGFSSGAVVHWNGSPRTTEVISSSQLKATIGAADVAKAGTASVTVVNPTPGGRTSTPVYFLITQPSSSVAMAAHPNTFRSGPVVTGDFDNDGKFDVVVGHIDDKGNWVISLFRGNGDGTFKKPINTVIPGNMAGIVALGTGDFDGDGKLDLALEWEYESALGTIVLLNNGDGTFRGGSDSWSLSGLGAFADLSGDGMPDAVTVYPNNPQASVLLGSGGGDFEFSQYLDISQLSNVDVAAIGDFNGDGNLDIAIPGGGQVLIFLGKGDGTFPQEGVSYSTGDGDNLVTADVNGDGKLDLVMGGCVLIGKGDGTFTQGKCAGNWTWTQVADFNGDGKLDLVGMAVDSQYKQTIYIALGNGDGTFQRPIAFDAGTAFDGGVLFAAGDFKGDGKLDLVVPDWKGSSLFLQTVASVSPNSLSFGNVDMGAKSKPQTVTLKNIGSSALKIDGIKITGEYSDDFVEANNCGTSLPAGSSCKIRVTFTPKAEQKFDASFQVNYAGEGGPQVVPLSGNGVAGVSVSLTPSKLTFPVQLVGTTGSAKLATLTNTGSVAVTISKISATAPFSQTNNCPSSLGAGASCQIQVSFKPTVKGLASGKLSVADDAPGSPQTVALSGIGTEVELSPIAVNFAGQKVGGKSAPVPVELTNKGTTTLSISQITVSGKDAGDFSQSNNCGHSVPAGGSCTIKVAFKPTAKGRRAANVALSDDGGGSPQGIPLSGTGT